MDEAFVSHAKGTGSSPVRGQRVTPINCVLYCHIARWLLKAAKGEEDTEQNNIIHPHLQRKRVLISYVDLWNQPSQYFGRAWDTSLDYLRKHLKVETQFRP